MGAKNQKDCFRSRWNRTGASWAKISWWAPISPSTWNEWFPVAPPASTSPPLTSEATRKHAEPINVPNSFDTVPAPSNNVFIPTDTYYLRNGDIAAVVLGVVLLLILLVALCFLIRFCCRRRKSRSVNTAPLPRSKKDQKWLARFSPERNRSDDDVIIVRPNEGQPGINLW